MIKPPMTVSIVGCDAAHLPSLKTPLREMGFSVRVDPTDLAFEMERRLNCRLCLMDVKVWAELGTDQNEWRGGNELPAVVLLTGHASIPLAVRAMRQGVAYFLTKPICRSQLSRATDIALSGPPFASTGNFVPSLIRTLTPRERQVLELVMEGQSSRAITELLELSQKTVEAYRARVMSKMQAESVAELAHIRRCLQTIDEDRTMATSPLGNATTPTANFAARTTGTQARRVDSYGEISPGDSGCTKGAQSSHKCGERGPRRANRTAIDKAPLSTG